MPYRPAGKCMCQPRLIKAHRTFIDKDCLSSDLFAITFTYFLNPPYPSLKYAMQFVTIEAAQNRMQQFKFGLRQPPESVRVFLSL
jgi:hypothetical protein